MSGADAGRGGLSGPEHLIDKATGEVTLALRPVFLARLHPPEMKSETYPCGSPEAKRFGSPFLRSSEATTIKLKGGMGPREVADNLLLERAGDFWNESWYRWIAAANTPFGWVEHPTPRFFQDPRRREGREELASLSLPPSCHETEEAAEEALLRWSAKELGITTAEGKEPEWQFPWGKVAIGHDRDGWWPELVIMWEPFSSAALIHVQSKLNGK